MIRKLDSKHHTCFFTHLFDSFVVVIVIVFGVVVVVVVVVVFVDVLWFLLFFCSILFRSNMYWSLTLGSMHVVGVDTESSTDLPEVTAGQLAWIKEDLKKVRV